MTETYDVRISDDSLVFSAAHFITYGGGECERLHGHNYRVAAQVAGPLDAHACVIDFLALRKMLQSIIGELDHRVLLPAIHPSIGVSAGDGQIDVTFGEAKWTFPRGDCVLLPVANTTAELLAEHIGTQLAERIESALGRRPGRIRIEVEESPGQAAACELDGD